LARRGASLVRIGGASPVFALRTVLTPVQYLPVHAGITPPTPRPAQSLSRRLVGSALRSPGSGRSSPLRMRSSASRPLPGV